MTDQKRKSTRNFNLLKPESNRVFDLNKEADVPASMGKKKLLIPIIIIGLLIVLVGGYFLLKPSNNLVTTTAQKTTQPVNSEVVDKVAETSAPGQEQPADSDQSTDIKGANVATSENQTNAKYSNNQQAKPNPPKENKPATEVPYNKGETYKVYQFPFGEYNYSQANPELDKLADVLRQNPSMKISIFAYTDDIGDATINMTISTVRANSIHKYLVNKGIDAGRMKFQGKGISTKYATKAENRRVEFVMN